MTMEKQQFEDVSPIRNGDVPAIAMLVETGRYIDSRLDFNTKKWGQLFVHFDKNILPSFVVRKNNPLTWEIFAPINLSRVPLM